MRPKDRLAKLNLASDLPPDHELRDVCPGVALPGWNGALSEVAPPRVQAENCGRGAAPPPALPVAPACLTSPPRRGH